MIYPTPGPNKLIKCSTQWWMAACAWVYPGFSTPQLIYAWSIPSSSTSSSRTSLRDLRTSRKHFPAPYSFSCPQMRHFISLGLSMSCSWRMRSRITLTVITLRTTRPAPFAVVVVKYSCESARCQLRFLWASSFNDISIINVFSFPFFPFPFGWCACPFSSFSFFFFG